MSTKPMDISKLTEEQFNKELEKGYKDVLNDKVCSAEEVFEGMSKDYQK